MYVNKTKAIINIIFYKWPDCLCGEVTHPSDVKRGYTNRWYTAIEYSKKWQIRPTTKVFPPARFSSDVMNNFARRRAKFLPWCSRSRSLCYL